MRANNSLNSKNKYEKSDGDTKSYNLQLPLKFTNKHVHNPLDINLLSHFNMMTNVGTLCGNIWIEEISVAILYFQSKTHTFFSIHTKYSESNNETHATYKRKNVRHRDLLWEWLKTTTKSVVNRSTPDSTQKFNMPNLAVRLNDARCVNHVVSMITRLARKIYCVFSPLVAKNDHHFGATSNALNCLIQKSSISRHE